MLNFNYVPLQNAGGDDHTWSGNINASGQTAGYSDVSKNGYISDAVVWSTSGQARVNQTTDGPCDYVNALNNISITMDRQ